MSVAFRKGQSLGGSDLMIAVRDSYGVLFDPAIITYSLFDYSTGVEVLIGAPNRPPESSGVGMFHVPGTIPLDASIGEWVVRWNMRQYADSAITQVAQRFQVVGEEVVTSITSNSTEQTMVRRLRTLLRDNNPDRNYRFRPPNTEKFLQAQTETMGYIWEDEELYEYVLMSVDTFNAAPPVTGITARDLPDRWRTVVLMGAAAHACRAMALNWVADEFSLKGSERVKLSCSDGGEDVEISLEDLYSLVKDCQDEENTLLAEDGARQGEGTSNRVYEALCAGRLTTLSCSVDGAASQAAVLAVARHHTPHKRIVRVSTKCASVVVTEDHSLFLMQGDGAIADVQSRDLAVGDHIAVVIDGRAEGHEVLDVEDMPSEEYTYDLSVPGYENFVLTNGILAHNSYSISGVSLDIDKSSKYLSLKENFEGQHEKMLEQAKSSIKIVKGLQQPRYGIGISSALGPFSRVGVQSRRNYISGGNSWS